MATTTAPLCKMMDDYVTWEVVVSCSDESRRETACSGLKGFAQTYLQEGRWGLVNAVIAQRHRPRLVPDRPSCQQGQQPCT